MGAEVKYKFCLLISDQGCDVARHEANLRSMRCVFGAIARSCAPTESGKAALAILSRIPVEFVPAWDDRAKPVYILLALTFAVTAGLFLGMGFSLLPAPSAGYPLALLIGLYSAGIFRRGGYGKTAAGLEASLLIAAIGSVFFILQFPLAALAVGEPDEFLGRADRMLGFDWVGFVRTMQSESLKPAWRLIYDSMIPQCTVAVVILSIRGDLRRVWQFATAVYIALLGSIAPFPFFAAKGTYVGCGTDYTRELIMDGTCRFGNIIQFVENEDVRIVTEQMKVGLVSFTKLSCSGLYFTYMVYVEN